jgi:hypothetical protein
MVIRKTENCGFRESENFSFLIRAVSSKAVRPDNANLAPREKQLETAWERRRRVERECLC